MRKKMDNARFEHAAFSILNFPGIRENLQSRRSTPELIAQLLDIRTASL